MLSGSQSYILIAFWKIFFFTVVFGLFQGLVLLPVILCYLGPSEKQIDASKSNDGGQVNNAMENDATVHI